MLNIPRLRNALKKLESSSDLAKFLIQRATAVAGTINKEYDAAAATTLENLPTVTSSAPSSAVVTSLSLKSLPPPNTHTFANSSAKASAEAIVGTELMYTEQENQPKTITAAIATVSLFSRSESSSGAAEVTASQNNLREQSVLQGNNNFTENRKLALEPPSQTNYTMSDAKAKEVTNHQAAEADSQLPKSEEKATSNGASCGSGSDQKQSNGSSTEKSCFKSSLADILHFMELVGNLKHTKRTGWVLRDVNDCESISGHMYRMSMMTFLLDGSEGLNQIRCMELALVHDLAESLVGDLTPFCGVAKEDKKAMELKAMEDICKLIEPRGKRIMELFEEYEGATSAESKFVKDLDRLDMVMQAFEYEKRDNCLMKHQEFFDSTEGKFQHPFVQKLVQEICDQRKALAETKGVANEGNLKLKTVTPNCPPCLEHKNERS